MRPVAAFALLHSKATKVTCYKRLLMPLLKQYVQDFNWRFLSNGSGHREKSSGP